MDFFTFLKECKKPHFFDTYTTICFRVQSDVQPLLFFSSMISMIKKTSERSVESVCLVETDTSMVMAKMATSFLGLTSVYWFKNITALKPKKSKELVDYLKTYTGPHCILFVLDETIVCPANCFSLTISVPTLIGTKECLALCEFMYGVDEKIRPDVVHHLFKKVRQVSLDNACLLLQYMRLAGRGADEFLQQWSHKIVAPEHSLVQLSSSFFAKDKQQFFLLWQQMGQDYSAQFWISFWSEQMWRAYNFVEQSRKQNYAEAKRVSFRLPNNFIQKLWAQTQLDELRNAHDFLYLLDCSLKNGGAETSLELFYTNFFTEQFRAA